MINFMSSDRRPSGNSTKGFVSKKYLSNYGDFKDKKLSQTHIEGHDSYLRNQKSADSIVITSLSNSMNQSGLNYEKRKNRASLNNLNYYNDKANHSTNNLRASDLNFYLKKDNNQQKYHEMLKNKHLTQTQSVSGNYFSKFDSKSNSSKYIRNKNPYEKPESSTEARKHQFEGLRSRSEYKDNFETKNYSRSSIEGNALNNILSSGPNKDQKPYDYVKSLSINQNSNEFTKNDRPILVQSSSKDANDALNIQENTNVEVKLEEFHFETQKKDQSNILSDSVDQVKLEESIVNSERKNVNEQESEELSIIKNTDKPVQMLDENKSGSIKYKDYLKDVSKTKTCTVSQPNFYRKKEEEKERITPDRKSATTNPVSHEKS